METDKVKKQLDVLKTQLDKARKMLLEEKIDPTDYKEMKVLLEPEINDLVKKQLALGCNKGDEKDVIDFGFYFLYNIGKVFPGMAFEEKRRIVSSTFPRKVVIDDDEVRTNDDENVLILISKPDKHLTEKKEGKLVEFSFPSRRVACTGVEPVIPP